MKLATAAVLIATSTVAATLPAIAAGQPAREGKSAPNHAAYWGDDCIKVDHGVGSEGVTLVVERDYRLVVLKSATTNDAFDDVRAGDLLSTSTGQAISHYILCAGASVASTTTLPSTTLPSTTLTTSTTVPPTTTVPVVPASVPTTTTLPSTTLPSTTVPSTTLTTSTTVPSTSLTTSTTVPPTTTVPVPPAPSTPAPPLGDDAPVTAAPTAQISAVNDERLAFTGADVWGIVLLGIVLIGLGTTMTRVRRLVEVRYAERPTTAGD